MVVVLWVSSLSHYGFAMEYPYPTKQEEQVKRDNITDCVPCKQSTIVSSLLAGMVLVLFCLRLIQDDCLPNETSN